MGERGPTPTPSAVKIARGTYRPDRAAANEAKPAGRPTCPSWLGADAKKEFRRLLRLLGEMGLVGGTDGNALARYCQTWVRWRKAVANVEKFGEMQVFKDDQGKVKAIQLSPYAALSRSLADELNRLEQALGLNPSARSRINVAPSGDGGLELPE